MLELSVGFDAHNGKSAFHTWELSEMFPEVSGTQIGNCVKVWKTRKKVP